jgi:hypothetical protein
MPIDLDDLSIAESVDDGTATRRIMAVVATVVLVATTVIAGRWAATAADRGPDLGAITTTRATSPDPRTPDPGTRRADGAPAGLGQGGASVPGTTRLVLLGPLPLLDTRDISVLSPGADVIVPLPILPPGTSAVLVEVSLLDARGAGGVTIDSTAGPTPVLRAPAAGAQTTATTVALVGPDGTVRIRTEGGGHLVVNLIGAFEPAEQASAGRIVTVPPTVIATITPEIGGPDATVDLGTVPALRDAGPVGAVLVQVVADVGSRGGLVSAGSAPDRQDQTVFWSATATDDRTRVGFLVVPVTDGALHVHYRAGRRLTASVVGYVTDATAPSSGTGLVVPVPPTPMPPTRVGADDTAQVALRLDRDLPADRVAAVLVGVAAVGDAEGELHVHGPDGPPPAPTLMAAAGVSRPALALVETRGGSLQVRSQAGASVTLTPQAIVIGG